MRACMPPTAAPRVLTLDYESSKLRSKKWPVLGRCRCMYGTARSWEGRQPERISGGDLGVRSRCDVLNPKVRLRRRLLPPRRRRYRGQPAHARALHYHLPRAKIKHPEHHSVPIRRCWPRPAVCALQLDIAREHRTARQAASCELFVSSHKLPPAAAAAAAAAPAACDAAGAAAASAATPAAERGRTALWQHAARRG